MKKSLWSNDMANKLLLNELININNNLILNYQSMNDFENLKKHQMIAAILKEPNAFDKIDIAVALNIIVDITKDEQNAFEIYKEIMLTNGNDQ